MHSEPQLFLKNELQYFEKCTSSVHRAHCIYNERNYKLSNNPRCSVTKLHPFLFFCLHVTIITHKIKRTAHFFKCNDTMQCLPRLTARTLWTYCNHTVAHFASELQNIFLNDMEKFKTTLEQNRPIAKMKKRKGKYLIGPLTPQCKSFSSNLVQFLLLLFFEAYQIVYPRLFWKSQLHNNCAMFLSRAQQTQSVRDTFSFTRLSSFFKIILWATTSYNKRNTCNLGGSWSCHRAGLKTSITTRTHTHTQVKSSI